MWEMELFYKVLEHKIRMKGIGFWNKKIIVSCCQIKHIPLPNSKKVCFCQSMKVKPSSLGEQEQQIILTYFLRS